MLQTLQNFGFSLRRTWIGLFTYFFSPVALVARFPFITTQNWVPEYNGYYFSIAVGGGYLATSFIGSVIFLLPCLWKKIKKENKEMAIYIAISLLLGIFIAAFESNKCGSIGRYMADFIWLFNIVTILLLLFIYHRLKKKEQKQLFIKIVIALIFISCIINLLMMYSYEGQLLKQRNNITIYYFIKYMLCFWI